MAKTFLVEAALGHGCGATRRFISEEIAPRLYDPTHNTLEDGAFIEIGGADLVVTADSYVVDPPIFTGGDIGRLAVSGTVNDLVASGATPRYLTLGLVVAEGFPMEDLYQVLDSIASTAKEADVRVVAGDTKVAGSTSDLGICLHTSGIGSALEKRYGLADASQGDVVIVTGYIGDHGFAVLSQREGLGFERRIGSDVAPLGNLILPLLGFNDGIHALRDPTRGGLLGVLHDIVDVTGCNLRLDVDRVPVRHEVRMGCDMLGLDPLDLVNEGKMVLVVQSNKAASVLAQLRQHPLGRQATVVGFLGRGSTYAGQVISVSNDGCERVMVRSEGLPIPRLC